MFEFFNTILNWLQLLSDFIVSTFRNLGLMIKLGFKGMAAIGQILAFFPVVVTGPIIALVMISLIVTLLNKWG